MKVTTPIKKIFGLLAISIFLVALLMQLPRAASDKHVSHSNDTKGTGTKSKMAKSARHAPYQNHSSNANFSDTEKRRRQLFDFAKSDRYHTKELAELLDSWLMDDEVAAFEAIAGLQGRIEYQFILELLEKHLSKKSSWAELEGILEILSSNAAIGTPLLESSVLRWWQSDSRAVEEWISTSPHFKESGSIAQILGELHYKRRSLKESIHQIQGSKLNAKMQQNVLFNLVRRWANEDVTSATEILSTIDGGSSLDGAFLAVSQALRETDPAASISYALAITDPAIGEEEIVETALQWSSKNEIEYKNWLEKEVVEANLHEKNSPLSAPAR